MDPTSETPERETPDEAFDRLRDADPSVSVAPDLTRMRDAVEGPGSAPGPVQPAADGIPTVVPTAVPEAVPAEVSGEVPDELAAARAERARRRPARWLQVAAAVAGIAVIGSGGFALGRRGGDGVSPAAASISLSDESAAVAAPQGASDSAGGSIAGSATEKMMASSWWGGRTVFTSSGLPTEGGTANAWTFDPSAVYSQETAARIAAALGVAGTPTEQEWSGWVVGPQDGSAPSVQLAPDGLASVSYYDPTRDPWACVQSAPDTPDASGTESDPAILDPTYGCAPSGAAAPSADAATAAARDAMSALGVDPAGYELEVVTDTGMQAAVSVSAYQVLEAQRTGVTWSFTVVADGVQSLYGALAPVVDLGSYEIVSPTEAVERLSDPRFGASFGGVMPLAEARTGIDTAEGSLTSESAVPAPTVPPTLEPGAAISWPVETVTLTTARLGLGMTTLTDGATVLLPSYELGSGDDDTTWSVNAVVADRLDFSPSR